MSFQIRKVKKGDEKILAYIQVKSWEAAFNKILDDETLLRCTNLDKVTSMYKRLLDNNIGNGYILEIDNKPHMIAYWDKTRTDNMPGFAELICIHSLPNHWRCGYGTQMMERVLNDIKNAGCKNVMLWVFKDNSRARFFYEHCGFATKGKEKPNVKPTEICYERKL